MHWLRTATERPDAGASAVEYGLVLAAVAAVIVVAVFALGEVTRETFANSCTTIRTTTSVAASCS